METELETKEILVQVYQFARRGSFPFLKNFKTKLKWNEWASEQESRESSAFE